MANRPKIDLDGKFEAYSKRTGKKHRIPAHYFDNPRLMGPFRLTPKTRAAADEAAVNQSPIGVNSDADDNPPAAGD